VVQCYEEHRGPFAELTEWDAYNYRAYHRALAGAEIDAGMEDIETALAALRGERPINPRNVERALGRQLEMANLLDTRALLYYHQEEYEKGLADMQEAIAAARKWLNFKSASRNWPDQSTKDATLREYRRILAVMYKHRMLLREGMSQELLADRDRQRIVQLGFDPEANLY
jgi:hypothetical protein